MTEEKIIELWIEKGVDTINFEFNCGGDDMGDTTLTILDKKGEPIECKEIEKYFDNEVYNNVDFYVNSDGHYMGEFGSVYITLEAEENEEPYFKYSKSSTEEYEEFEGFEEYVELTEEEVEYINSFVRSINTSWGDDKNFNYKVDFIKTDRHEELEKSIGDKITERWENYEPNMLGEVLDGQDENWNTNDEGEGKVLETNGTDLKVTLFYRSILTREPN